MIEKQSYLISGHPDEMRWIEAYIDSLYRHIEAVMEAGLKLGVPLRKLEWKNTEPV